MLLPKVLWAASASPNDRPRQQCSRAIDLIPPSGAKCREWPRKGLDQSAQVVIERLATCLFTGLVQRAPVNSCQFRSHQIAPEHIRDPFDILMVLLHDTLNFGAAQPEWRTVKATGEMTVCEPVRKAGPILFLGEAV